MKHIFIFFTACSFLLLSMTSCTDKNNDETTHRVEPGVYYIGKDLNAVVSKPTTKGVTPDFEFDSDYSYDVIYLHKIGTKDYITIPIVDNCPNATQTGTCKGIRYRVAVDESGKATITPLDANEKPVTDGGILELAEKDQCYFSSWPTDEWAMEEGQWTVQQWADDPAAYYLYYRKKTINKEIYRSGINGEIENLNIDKLTQNGDLNLTRACAGFMLATILYDGETYQGSGNNLQYFTTEKRFKELMGDRDIDSYKRWYIKMYLGGSCFPQSYDIETCTESNQNYPNGYYSSGDADKFNSGELAGQYFLPFSYNSYNKIQTSYGGYGYLTSMEEGQQNLLFSPVTGKTEIHVYVLIKHWTGQDEPSKEWLLSDIGALQTEINPTTHTTPRTGDFVQIAFLMDLSLFKKAWEDAGGDTAQNELIENAGIDTGTKTSSEDKSSSSLNTSIYSTTLTRSPSGDPVRTFTLPEDAIIIQEVY